MLTRVNRSTSQSQVVKSNFNPNHSIPVYIATGVLVDKLSPATEKDILSKTLCMMAQVGLRNTATHKTQQLATQFSQEQSFTNEGQTRSMKASGAVIHRY